MSFGSILGHPCMTKKLDILGDDSGDLEGISLSINSLYAKKYEERKRKQEIGHLEDKHQAKLLKKGKGVSISKTKKKNEIESEFEVKTGVDSESGSEEDSEFDSESDEEEDDDGELLTPAVDVQILKTLSEIRSRSDKVYDPSTRFFDENELSKIDQEWRKKHTNKVSSVSKNSKPVMTVKDYQRERILSGTARENSDQEEEDFEAEPLTHVQEQELLKAEMKKAFKSGIEEGEEEENESGLLSIRVKGDEEIAKEEEEYRNFLLENLASSENAKLSMGEWLSYREDQDGISRSLGKSKKQLSDDDFLIDYVLNKGWVDKQASRIPSYDKIIEEDIIDEEAVEVADEFELAHNFRYEQEGGTQIQTFARNVDGSMRREESKRKDQRLSAKERKALDRLQKDEELKRLKNLKMAEIKSKLDKINKVSALKSVNVEDIYEDLEDDFDPIKHDQMMQKLVDSDEEFDGKPVFSSDSEEEQETKPVIKKATKALKKAVKRSNSEEVEGNDESEKARLAKYLDELYNMDYEDLIGDIPCRFKYQRVEPSTYGLSLNDIITADDAQLNSFLSLKKLAPYRPIDVQEEDIRKYSSKHRVHQFRKSLKEAAGNEFEKKKSKKK